MTAEQPPTGERHLTVPDPSLIVLVGIAGSGKSTFARRQFGASEVVSSDACREMVADDAEDQSATADAFSLVTFIVDKRSRRGRLTAVDATNLERSGRRRLLGLARTHGLAAVAIVLAPPLEVCIRHDIARPGRTVGAAVLELQHAQLRRARPRLPDEGFTTIHALADADEIAAARVARVRPPQPPG